MGCLKRIELSYLPPQSSALTTKLQAPKNLWPHSYSDGLDNDSYSIAKSSWKLNYSDGSYLYDGHLAFWYHRFYTSHRYVELGCGVKRLCMKTNHLSNLRGLRQHMLSYAKPFGRIWYRRTYYSLIFAEILNSGIPAFHKYGRQTCLPFSEILLCLFVSLIHHSHLFLG